MHMYIGLTPRYIYTHLYRLNPTRIRAANTGKGTAPNRLVSKCP